MICPYNPAKLSLLEIILMAINSSPSKSTSKKPQSHEKITAFRAVTNFANDGFIREGIYLNNASINTNLGSIQVIKCGYVEVNLITNGQRRRLTTRESSISRSSKIGCMEPLEKIICYNRNKICILKYTLKNRTIAVIPYLPQTNC